MAGKVSVNTNPSDSSPVSALTPAAKHRLPHAESAVAAAEEIGYPVVLKVCGAALAHKTEVGGVALNLRSAQEVRDEAGRLLRIPGCEALLVAEMVKGDRELVWDWSATLNSDPV